MFRRILQLPYLAGPVVLLRKAEKSGAEGVFPLIFRVELAQGLKDREKDVLRPLAQRRNTDNIEAIKTDLGEAVPFALLLLKCFDDCALAHARFPGNENICLRIGCVLHPGLNVLQGGTLKQQLAGVPVSRPQVGDFRRVPAQRFLRSMVFTEN